MHNNTLSYILALGANFSFAIASIIFANYSRTISSLWMNTFKAVITLILLIFTLPLLGGFNPTEFSKVWPLFLSGFIGLTIGDIFLLRSFAIIGAGRTLILFGFQPVIMAISSLVLFSQKLQGYHLTAIIILMSCLFLFSYEGYKSSGKWELKGLSFALIGVLLDASGVLLSRYGFDLSDIKPVEGHFYRTVGSVAGFMLINYTIKPVNLIGSFKIQTNRGKLVLLFSAFSGTYLSLLLYMSAIKIGHLASVSAIAITGPLFATLFESIYYKKWPGKYLWMSLALFICGFIVLYKGANG